MPRGTFLFSIDRKWKEKKNKAFSKDWQLQLLLKKKKYRIEEKNK